MTTRIGVEALGGLDRLDATTRVLQRARLTHPTAGVWEAADVQWWWRRPRSSDEFALPVWSDNLGPCAAAVLTDWGDRWQADALAVPGTVDVSTVWWALVEAVDDDAPPLEVLARDDDEVLLALLDVSGFRPAEDRSGTTWMDAADRPPLAPVPDGFAIVDRATRHHGPHPMSARNGNHVEERLRQCSLYDPALDLAVVTAGGHAAGYALFWPDSVTGVGLLEPMRVEDAYQRRGLAGALLTEGLERLTRRGARRLKVGFDGQAGRNLYVGAGFETQSMLRAFRRPPDVEA